MASLLVLAASAPAMAATLNKPIEAYVHASPFSCSLTKDQFVLDAFRTTNNCGGIATKTGPGWKHSAWPYSMINNDYWYVTRSMMNGTETGSFSPTVKRTGLYEIWADWRSSVNRSPAIPFTVFADDGNKYIVTANQRHDAGYTAWGRLGTYRLNARRASATPKGGYVMIANGSGKACIDAVYFKYVGPATVEGLSASAGTSSAAVALAWTAGYKVRRYEVFRNKVNSNDIRTWTKIGVPTVAAFSDTTAEAGVNYFYKVRAYSIFGKLSDFSKPAKGFRSLEVPASVVASTTTSGKIDVSWTAVTGAVKYSVLRNTTNSLTGAVVAGSPATAMFTDTVGVGIVANTDYYYFVSAVGANGLPGVYSAGVLGRATP